MLNPEQKAKIIKKFQTHANDTGSPQVQIAILTEEIKQLTDHLKGHRKDHSSRRGLIKKVNERRKLLRYLSRDDAKAFEELVKKLKIKVRSTQEKSLDELEKEELQKLKEKEEWEKLAESPAEEVI